MRCLRACRQQQPQEPVDLVVGQRLSVDIRADEHADEVVLRLRAARGDDRRQVLAQVTRRLHPSIEVDGDADQLDRKARERPVILDRNAEDLRDHLDRVMERQLAHELGLTARGELVDQHLHRRPDERRLPVGQSLPAERAADDAAVAAVLGAVHLQDRRAHHNAHHRSEQP